MRGACAPCGRPSRSSPPPPADPEAARAARLASFAPSAPPSWRRAGGAGGRRSCIWPPRRQDPAGHCGAEAERRAASAPSAPTSPTSSAIDATAAQRDQQAAGELSERRGGGERPPRAIAERLEELAGCLEAGASEPSEQLLRPVRGHAQAYHQPADQETAAQRESRSLRRVRSLLPSLPCRGPGGAPGCREATFGPSAGACRASGHTVTPHTDSGGF
jgi:hypothetical protein